MLKLGVIPGLNVLSVYYGILEKRIPITASLIHGKVTELNRKLNQGQLDISVVSSFEYAKNPKLYYVLPELSISCQGPVRSIYLFLNKPVEKIDNDSINLTAYSLTSIHLIQYLLKDSKVQFTNENDPNKAGELLIADEAIRAFYQKRYPYVYDLGYLWFQKMGLPFVFALWVARRDSFYKSPEEILGIHKSLFDSKVYSRDKSAQIALKYNCGLFPSTKLCTSYLCDLRHDLSESYQNGFIRFQKEMVILKKLDRIAELQFLPSI